MLIRRSVVLAFGAVKWMHYAYGMSRMSLHLDSLSQPKRLPLSVAWVPHAAPFPASRPASRFQSATGLPDLPGHRGRRPELSTTHWQDIIGTLVAAYLNCYWPAQRPECPAPSYRFQVPSYHLPAPSSQGALLPSTRRFLRSRELF